MSEKAWEARLAKAKILRERLRELDAQRLPIFDAWWKLCQEHKAVKEAQELHLRLASLNAQKRVIDDEWDRLWHPPKTADPHPEAERLWLKFMLSLNLDPSQTPGPTP